MILFVLILTSILVSDSLGESAKMDDFSLTNNHPFNELLKTLAREYNFIAFVENDQSRCSYDPLIINMKDHLNSNELNKLNQIIHSFFIMTLPCEELISKLTTCLLGFDLLIDFVSNASSSSDINRRR